MRKKDKKCKKWKWKKVPELEQICRPSLQIAAALVLLSKRSTAAFPKTLMNDSHFKRHQILKFRKSTYLFDVHKGGDCWTDLVENGDDLLPVQPIQYKRLVLLVLLPSCGRLSLFL